MRDRVSRIWIWLIHWGVAPLASILARRGFLSVVYSRFGFVPQPCRTQVEVLALLSHQRGVLHRSVKRPKLTAKVFKKYSQMKLQMKREALEKLNRRASEMATESGERMCTVVVQ